MLPTTPLLLLAPLALALPTTTTPPSFPPPPANSTFHIRPHVTAGNPTLTDYYLTSFHTGAGTATLVATRNATLALPFYITANRLSSYSSSSLPPSQVALPAVYPYLSDAPQDFNVVTFNFTQEGEPGFRVVDGYVEYRGATAGFAGWALCAVNGTAPYLSAGPQVQLLWKTSGAVDGEKCADVALTVERCA